MPVITPIPKPFETKRIAGAIEKTNPKITAIKLIEALFLKINQNIPKNPSPSVSSKISLTHCSGSSKLFSNIENKSKIICSFTSLFKISFSHNLGSLFSWIGLIMLVGFSSKHSNLYQLLLSPV